MTDAVRPEKGGYQDVFYAKSNSVPLPLIERAAGIHLYDEDGNEYIDASSGPIVSNIGHGNEHVANAMAEQARTMDFAYSRVARHRPNIELTERIAKLAGPGFERVCLSSGGSETMEFCVKFLRQHALATGHPEKRKIITCLPSYHGGTIAMLGLSGDDALKPFLEDFGVASEKIPTPFTYRLPGNHTPTSFAKECADALEDRILALGPENVLAFAFEPVGGLGTGCNVPPDEYFTAIRQICDRHGVYLIFDEILCGTGRTGKFLAAHHWPDCRPDVIALAKGLGSGYAPLGAMLAPARMVDELADLTGFNYSHTYGANPIACATAMAVLDEYERLDLVGQAGRMGAYLRGKLEDIQGRSTVIGDIRGLGLVMAVEMVADKTTKAMLPGDVLPADRIRIHGLDNGLIIYTRRTSNGRYGDWFIVAPPMTITEAECDELAKRLERTIDAFTAELIAGGKLDAA